MACPPHSFTYNSSSLCSCDPGRYLTASGSCDPFPLPPGGDLTFHSSPGDDQSTLLTSFLSLDVVRRITSSQRVFLWSTASALVGWILFCAAVRFAPLRAGRSVWFRVRWRISRLDVVYAAHHSLRDRKVVVKRKTELGGMCSIASWILFIGLLSLLVYQIIANRNMEVDRIRPFNGPDLLLFDNDMEFNITTISSMSCSQLRGPNNVVIGTPGFIDYRVSSLSTYASFFCQNTSSGPRITIKCNHCQLPLGIFYISWQFVDLPKNPASAVAFQFNLTTKDHHDNQRTSFVSGTVKSGNYAFDMQRTFRGPDTNILKINMIPRIYRNLNNLSIIQPLFNDFLPGSYLVESNRLRASLESPNDGLINTTLSLRLVSDFIVEVDREKIISLVSFIANVGGVYALSAAIFLYLMLLCERSKRLQIEDTLFQNIMAKNRAQRNWDKVRKYVRYTWGCKGLEGQTSGSSQQRDLTMPNCLCGSGSFHMKRQRNRHDHEHASKLKNKQEYSSTDNATS